MANKLRARGKSAMRDFLGGRWKDDENKWWEISTEMDVERQKRVEVLGALMKGMDGLRVQ